MPEDFFLRTLRRHSSVRQHDEFLANAVGLFEIVAYEQRRSAVARQRFAKLALESAAQMRVKRGERFVQQQCGRLDGQRAGERHALLLAAGKRRRVSFREAIEMRGGKLFRDATIFFPLRQAPQSECDIFRHGQMRE